MRMSKRRIPLSLLAAFGIQAALAAAAPAATLDVTGTFDLTASASIDGEGKAAPQRVRSSAIVDGFDESLGILESVTIAARYHQDGVLDFDRGHAPKGSFASGASGFQIRLDADQIEANSLSLFSSSGETGRGGAFSGGESFSGAALEQFRGRDFTLDFILMTAVRIACGETGACAETHAATAAGVTGDWRVRYVYDDADTNADGRLSIVPVPASILLIPAGLLGLGIAARRRT